MANFTLAYALKKFAVDLFLFPAAITGEVLEWLSVNLVGFGLGFDSARGWYLRAYAVLDVPAAFSQYLRLQLPLIDVEFVVLSGRLQALGGGLATPAAPVRVGIGSEITTAAPTEFGTLCLFVQRQGVKSLLSCRHVLSGDMASPVLERMEGADGPEIGKLTDGSVFISGQGAPHAQPNQADFAIAAIDAGVQIDPTLPFGLGPLDPHPVNPTQGLAVVSAGRSPQRKGTVFDNSVDLKIDYPKNTLFFSDQILIQGQGGEPFAHPGDSGALVVDTSTPCRAVAMVFAGGTPTNPAGGPALPPGMQLTAGVPLARLIETLHVNLIT
jgi:hypothetical protein